MNHNDTFSHENIQFKRLQNPNLEPKFEVEVGRVDKTSEITPPPAIRDPLECENLTRNLNGTNEKY